ncbi:hypothetical protein RCL1_007623 [Eukaryota sp. TZLM3-RCL]
MAASQAPISSSTPPHLRRSHSRTSSLVRKVLHRSNRANPITPTCPPNHEFHKAVAAADSEEHVITRVVSSRDTPSGPLFTVEWYGGESTEVPLDSIKNTKAYSLYRAKHKPPPLQSPPSKRARSRREKRQC